ncbi:hypothetical protein MalM25_28090 [Planctomycetes bacterium MalM25]|nr:hypothetical protein MalM25_28090 [Planctomycetes bacterium MalM25]
MLILLSPAKTLDFTPTERDLPTTKPALHTQAKQLTGVAKGLSVEEVAKLMNLSDNLAATAHGYLQDWKAKWDPAAAKPAALAFRGDVYQGLDADTLTDKQLIRAQDQIRILSGLYGVLRPLDLIQPYRLEMGRKLANPRGKDLYAWWSDRVTDTLNRELAESKDRLIVNLASNEYAAVIDFKRLDAEVVTPVFKDKKGDAYKVISFFAKRARGRMARHFVRSRASGRRAIESFDAGGYAHCVEQSSADSPVFLRDSSAE